MNTTTIRAIPNLIRWLAFSCLLLAGCSASDGGTGGGAEFGAPCTKSEDCASGLCIRRDATGGICTRACTSTSECPASSNWGCVQPDHFDASVCACVPDGSQEICGDGVDNDCNGRVDDCQLCNGKPVPADDPENCGKCGNACSPDQICALGSCSCPPTANFVCGGKCANLDADPKNCGKCGNACPTGQTCENGACACATAGAPDYCAGAGCIDLATNTAHCGSCGNACDFGLECKGGKCECPASSPGSFCPGVGCIDLKSDVSNCGQCGKKCASGASCLGGNCACPAGTNAACNDVCVSTQTDPANCGSCGTACPAAQQCIGGTCTCGSSALTYCSPSCVNLATDAQNCGACGNACKTAQSCVAGSCKCPYTTPNECGSTCVNIANDTQNCGSCGNACPSPLVCGGGACGCPSTTPTACNGGCVNINNDAANCGACGTVCGAGQYCNAGKCACSTSGLSVCSGTCVDTKSDANNCGSCGNACPGGQICSASTCKCPTGTSWCAQSNSCVSLLTDFNNCGTCGKVCNVGQSCVSGVCKCPNANELWCASSGACIDVLANSNDCGACDKVCPAQTTCVSAACKCNQAGYSLCGSTCYDLKNDSQHCGSCTNACSGNMSCATGSCGCPAPGVGAALRLTTTAPDSVFPAAAWDGTHVGVVWAEGTYSSGGYLNYGNVYFALLNADGTRALTPDLALTTLTGSNYVDQAPSIAWSGSEYGIVWHQTISGYYVQRIAPDGTPKGAAVNVTSATPGAKLQAGPARITWNPVYGGYALAVAYYSVYFQRIGTDGTAPDPVNFVSLSVTDPRVGFAVSPSGEWAVAGYYGGSVYLVFFNADGSHTKPNSYITGGGGGSLGLVDLIHDGTTWDTVFHDSLKTIRINRGEVANPTPFTLVTTSTGNIGAVDIEASGTGALELAWIQPNDIHLRRYLLPAGTSPALTQIGSEVSLLSTQNALQVKSVHTGPGSMLELWSDNRWGAAELYAEPMSFSACP